MIYIEHDTSDLFVLSQKVLACLLGELRDIPKRARSNRRPDRSGSRDLRLTVGILMFVTPSYYWNGLNRQVEEHLLEIIDDDRRLSRLVGVEIKVTIQETQQLAKKNLIGLVFRFS